MIVKHISIQNFRGMNDLEFELGNFVTVIAGQNGTQKTTVLGMLRQTFTITDQSNPMISEKPLSGGSFKSSMAEMFKFSDVHDKPGNHQWTVQLSFKEEPFSIESIPRKEKQKSEKIRFFPKGDRSKGSGFIQLPAIYLSLNRLMPIGEISKIGEDKSIILTKSESEFYKKWHRKILISQDKINESKYISGSLKRTLGAETSNYDWKQNSAGQDNIGKLILAVITFKRLKESYPNDYKGGILAIDEIDATLYPAAQIELLKALRKFASNYDIQVIATSHSLTLLEKAFEMQQDQRTKGQVKVVYLEKKDDQIFNNADAKFEYIIQNLNVICNEKPNRKIDVYTEDKEALKFAKSLLKTKICSHLNFIDISLGCGNLIELALKKIPSFSFPNSIILLDGDVRKKRPKEVEKIMKLKNVLVLPSDQSPEQLLATFLDNEKERPSQSNTGNVWQKLGPSFNKQVCFRGFELEKILRDREEAKKWFIKHNIVWGRNASKIISPWIKNNGSKVNAFLDEFKELFNKIADHHLIEKL